MKQIEMTPIGEVRSSFAKPLSMDMDYDAQPEGWKTQIRAYQRKVRTTVSRLVIRPEYEELLEGIEEFSHILVLFWPHLIDPERRKIQKTHPMGRKDLPQRGIFSTCSPARPNPVLVTAVELVGRKGNMLLVKGLEAVDGTPIIDIKPYSRNYHLVSNPESPAWMQRLHEDIGVR